MYRRQVPGVLNSLPIEPIRFKGSYTNGFLQEISDDGASDLTRQVCGIYVGWVDFESQKRFKIVVSIRWDSSLGSFWRNIQACFINGSNDQICDQLMEAALVGYIRGFHTKVLILSFALVFLFHTMAYGL
ncbi:bifunctional riboflavin kinase/FMN phosphatase-like [Rutidosis leptorrhynchoides]|uniref:bifunctional riboflavin kinase/FMN phosphatase-like n=1 Tax=Rutidosis leptorrhynchoides TaxID=125765 RepID=UPI003A98E40B